MLNHYAYLTKTFQRHSHANIKSLAFLGKGVNNLNFTSEHDKLLAIGKYLLLNYPSWDHMRPR